MRKIVMAIKVTPEGFCDHRALIADGELHKFYNDLLKKCGHHAFWPKDISVAGTILAIGCKKLTGSAEQIEFAELATAIHKNYVFKKRHLTGMGLHDCFE
jgi:dihydrofolate reductase